MVAELQTDTRRFDRPGAVAVSPDGTILAIAQGDSVTLRADLAGPILTTIEAAAGSLLFAPSGELALQTTHGLQLVSREGVAGALLADPRLTKAPDRLFSFADRMAWSRDGALFLQADFALWRRPPDHSAPAPIAEGIRCSHHVVLTDGRVAVNDRNAVTVHDFSAGTELHWVADDFEARAHGLVALSGNRLLVNMDDGWSLLSVLADGVETLAVGPELGSRLVPAAGDHIVVIDGPVVTLVDSSEQPTVVASIELDEQPCGAASGAGRTVIAVGPEVIEYDDTLREVTRISPGSAIRVWGVGFAGPRVLIGAGDHVWSDDVSTSPLLDVAELDDHQASNNIDLQGTADVACASRLRSSGPMLVIGDGLGQVSVSHELPPGHSRSYSPDGTEYWGAAGIGSLVRMDVLSGEVTRVDLSGLTGSFAMVPRVHLGWVVAITRDGQVLVVDRSSLTSVVVEMGRPVQRNSIRSIAVNDERVRVISAGTELLEVPLNGQDSRTLCTLPAVAGRENPGINTIWWSLAPGGERIVGRHRESGVTVVVDDNGDVVAQGVTPAMNIFEGGQPVWSDDGRYAWLGQDGSIVIVHTE